MNDSIRTKIDVGLKTYKEELWPWVKEEDEVFVQASFRQGATFGFQLAVEEHKEVVERLRIAANQLDGVALAFRKHGQNLNVEFFISTYRKFSEQADQALRDLEEKLK